MFLLFYKSLSIILQVQSSSIDAEKKSESDVTDAKFLWLRHSIVVVDDFKFKGNSEKFTTAI